MSKKMGILMIVLSLVVVSPAALAGQEEIANQDTSFCEIICSLSDWLCRQLCGGGGGSGGGGGGKLEGPWDPTVLCTQQVPVGHSQKIYDACEKCCGVILSDGCVALCIEDHS